MIDAPGKAKLEPGGADDRREGVGAGLAMPALVCIENGARHPRLPSESSLTQAGGAPRLDQQSRGLPHEAMLAYPLTLGERA